MLRRRVTGGRKREREKGGERETKRVRGEEGAERESDRR